VRRLDVSREFNIVSEYSKVAALVAATLAITTAVKLAPPEVCEHDGAAVTCPAPRDEPADIRESQAESPTLSKAVIESGPSAAPPAQALPPGVAGNAAMLAQPQNFRYTPPDDSWWTKNMPMTLRVAPGAAAG
jgi:hypothetical protein